MEQAKPAENAAPAGGESTVDVFGSASLTTWLSKNDISLAFTTYQAGRLMLVGVSEQGPLTVKSRTFPRCMGLFAAPDTQTIFLTTGHQIWRLANVLEPGDNFEGSNQLYVPRVGYTTGRIDAHDIVVDDAGTVYFVATAFNCIATLDPVHNFRPTWLPPFISKVVNKDHCHLNGLALRDGHPRYATAVTRSDTPDGWRDWRNDGGVVVDILTNDVIATGLSMPHSPRFYEGRLWLHNAGTGKFGQVDLNTGAFTPVAFCPGFLRGLAFFGHYAVIGLSKLRDKTFTGLALEERLAKRHLRPQCGIHIIDMRTGDVVKWLRVDGPLAELYDVAVLPGARMPTAFGLQGEAMASTVSLPK